MDVGTKFDSDGELRLIGRIFDAEFYRVFYNDAGETNEEAWKHFRSVGIVDNRRPHPLFDPGFYLVSNPDVAASGMPAIVHYVRYGGREWRHCSPFVNMDAYFAAYRAEVAVAETGSMLEDFVLSSDRRLAFEFFDHDFYGGACTGVPFNRTLESFFAAGLRDKRNPHPLIEIERLSDRDSYLQRFLRFEWLFLPTGKLGNLPTHVLVDPAFYTTRFGGTGVHPVIHFLREGRHRTDLSTHPLFDPEFYKRAYGKEHNAEALTAYVRGGMDATAPNAFFDPARYRQAYGKEIKPGESALEHYIRHGHLPWFDPGPRFAQRFYLSRHPAVVGSGQTALGHFLHIGRAKGLQARPTAPVLDTKRQLSRAEVVRRIRASARPGEHAPEVSVIVPTYGQADSTLRCVLSMLRSRDRTAFEIVVVDDASPDGSGAAVAEALEGLAAVRVVCNARNLGFLLSCNAAAATCASAYLYFLNNDTVVLDGWLDELVGTFAREADAGLVGAKLVYPDGRLQDAGGLVWSDGSAANLGRLDDPFVPTYGFQRDVDYVSGAAILVAADAWRAVGGFSEEFAPAYYEDTDLAMKLRAAGRRVIYQPLAAVVHYEGISSGTDVTAGVKRYQVVNREKFIAKWRDALAGNGRSGDLSRRSIDRRARGRLLFVDAEVPMPDRDSGSVTTFFYLKILARLGYRVTFIAENAQRNGRYAADLQRLGIEVLHTPYVENAADYILTRADDYDMVVLARATVGGSLLPAVKARFPAVPVVFDTVDLHHVRLLRQHEQTQDPAVLAKAHLMKEIEVRAIAAADATLIVSEVEAAIMADEIGPFPHVIVPLIYEPYTPKNGFAERRDVVFVGGFRHPPNVDAALFLARDVWPRVRAIDGMEGARLHIVGAGMTPEVAALAAPDILTAGYVEDLEGCLERIRVSVAPLRFGAGVKGKIGNALRLGLPVVATPLGVEGMHLVDGTHCLVGADELALAEAIARLYREEALWTALSRNGKAFADEAFGIEAATERLRDLCAALIPRRS